MFKRNKAKKKNTYRNEAKTASSKKQGKRKKTTGKKPGLFKPGFFKSHKARKITGLFLIVFSLFMVLAFISYIKSWFTWGSDEAFTSGVTFNTIFMDYPEQVHNWMGRLGAFLSHLFIKEWFGIASLLFALLIFIGGWRMLKVRLLPLWKTIRYSVFFLVWISVSLGFIFHNSDYAILGGVFGYEGSQWLQGVFGMAGAGLILLFLLLSFLVAAYNIPFRWMKPVHTATTPAGKKQKTKSPGDNGSNHKPGKYNVEEYAVDDEDQPETTEPIKPGKKISKKPIDHPDEQEEMTSSDSQDQEQEGDDDQEDEIKFTVKKAETSEDVNDNGNTAIGKRERQSLDTPYDPTLDLSDYQFPTLDLLEKRGDGTINVESEELKANKKRIIDTLNNYNIKITQIKATIGPTITLYEIVPAPGIRISKIKNLEDDIALSLAATGIRIIAPIPGRGTIGIEVPNNKPEIVSIRSLLASSKFRDNKYELPIAIGKTISNESFITDLAKFPHILMAGATGQGKSVGLNAIIASLIYKKHPSELKFIMIDPKKVELSLYSKIERHFIATLPEAEEAIITDTRQVVKSLNSLNIEMDNRYDLLKNAQVRNLKEYNHKFVARRLNPEEGHRYLPYLVLVIDEFADLIMTAGKEIEMPLTRLAQLARAVGIHLVIATQRPSVNIITGTIKANFPARIAFRVISKTDSRTILDVSGADQLVGRGDMLLATGSELTRLQCAFIDTDEVEKVTEFIGAQRGFPSAFLLPDYEGEESGDTAEYSSDERDDLFEEAARLVVATQQGSTSLIQRKLKLGYNRAGRIIDQLEAAGIVGPFEGSKAREVLIKDEYSLEQHLNNLNK
ncbi:MAG: DNA translocase FtsK [Bacteroidales bacterium]|nr:DNA translocase FtsK [Bacteroidales bacterium]